MSWRGTSVVPTFGIFNNNKTSSRNNTSSTEESNNKKVRYPLYVSILSSNK